MAIKHLNYENFTENTSQDGIVIIDFWAEWCGACKDFNPIYEKVANKFSQHVFAKIDTVKEKKLTSVLEIENIPTLMIYRDGILIFQQPGYYEEDKLQDIIKQAENIDMQEVKAHIESKKLNKEKTEETNV